MMNFKRFVCVLAAFALFAGSGFAQQSKSDENVEFVPHWNAQLQGGAAYTLGEGKFTSLLSPAAFLTAGYQFHPAMGVRFGLGGWQGRGAAVVSNETYSFNFLQGLADFVVDLNALFGGYDHNRVFSTYVFAGASVLGGLGNEKAKTLANAGDPLSLLWEPVKVFPAGRAGLGVNFNVTDRIALNVEGNAEILPDSFNSKKAENPDWQFNLLLGVTYHFGKTYKRNQPVVVAPVVPYVPETEPVTEPEPAVEPEPIVEPAETPEEVHVRLAAEQSQNIYFLINMDRIEDSEKIKLDTLAEWLRNNEDYRVSLVGYADRETGNAQLNERLSARRAENVRKYLVNAGIAADRIDTDYRGDREQPFATPEENRVVICTLE